MTAAASTQTVLSRAVIAVVLVLIGLGLLWYGLSAETHQRIWRDIFDRPGDPMAFRFILQPAMASIAAVADGVNDARSGRTPYLWAIITRSSERVTRLNEGLNATARVFLIGFAMDAIYQFRVSARSIPSKHFLSRSRSLSSRTCYFADRSREWLPGGAACIAGPRAASRGKSHACTRKREPRRAEGIAAGRTTSWDATLQRSASATAHPGGHEGASPC